jgi:hypothetical protein
MGSRNAWLVYSIASAGSMVTVVGRIISRRRVLKGFVCRTLSKDGTVLELIEKKWAKNPHL